MQQKQEQEMSGGWLCSLTPAPAVRVGCHRGAHLWPGLHPWPWFCSGPSRAAGSKRVSSTAPPSEVVNHSGQTSSQAWVSGCHLNVRRTCAAPSLQEPRRRPGLSWAGRCLPPGTRPTPHKATSPTHPFLHSANVCWEPTARTTDTASSPESLLEGIRISKTSFYNGPFLQPNSHPRNTRKDLLEIKAVVQGETPNQAMDIFGLCPPDAQCPSPRSSGAWASHTQQATQNNSSPHTGHLPCARCMVLNFYDGF